MLRIIYPYFSYNGKPDETLTSLRYASFMSMVSKRFQLQPENLPPTERAAFYHSLRVHLQVCQWKYLELDILDATKWGWKLINGITMAPVKTDLQCAPEWLLNVIHCNCKLSSKIPCGTKLCSCRKNRLNCVPACGDCKGKFCDNKDEQTNELTGTDDLLDEELENIFDRNTFDIFE